MKAISPLRLVTLPVLALATVGLPSCKRSGDAQNDPEWWRLEAERVQLVQEIQLQQMRLGDASKGQDYAAAKEAVERNERYLADLKAEGADLKAEISDLVASVEQLHQQWVADTRAAAVGHTYATLTAKGGRTYENVVVTKVSDVGIEIRHSTGTARLAATDLDPALHEVFALDSMAAMAALEQERAAAQAYEAWIDDRVAIAHAEQKEDARLAAEREADHRLELAKARSQAVASTDQSRSRLHDEPRSLGGVRYSTWYPDSYYYSRSRYYYNPVYVYGGLRSNEYVRAMGISVSGGCVPRVTPVTPRTTSTPFNGAGAPKTPGSTFSFP